MVDDETLVFNADIAISATILIFAIVSLPRVYSRFCHSSEWSRGYLLRSVTKGVKQNIKGNPISYPIGHQDSSFVDFDPDPSLTVSDSPQHLKTRSTDTVSFEKNLPTVPHRTRTLSSIFHPVASVLSHRVHDNYSLGQVLLMLAYTAVIFYVSFYMSNPFTDPHRSGWVITSQVPIVYALATKNNLIGMMIGVAYEKLNFLHRLVGRLMVIGANVHFIGYVYKWSLNGTIQKKLAEDYVRWGIVALIAFDLLGICSTSFVRAKAYNLFLATHVVGLNVFLVAVCYHEPGAIPYVMAAVVLYGLDHVIRVIKTRITTARLHPLPELGITKVEVSSLNAGWRAGQHVRMRVLSTSMGWWGWSEVHPFTIANTTHTPEGMILMCKKTGSWTDNLFKIAQTSSYGESGKETGRNVTVIVEGPYGGVGHTVMSSFSGAIFVVGGSGVTFALSAVQDLIQAGGASHTKVIDIVWSIPDPASLAPLLAQLSSFVAKRESVRVRVHVFYTRAISTTFDGMYVPRGITLLPGRPKLDKLLGAMINDTMSSGGKNGVFVGVCGPVGLANSMARVVKKIDPRLRSGVGGVELHEETFGW